MELSKKKLLILIDWFSPGYKGGGPVQSILNLANALKDELEVKVVTRNTDYGEMTPYQTVRSDEWVHTEIGFAVMYLSSGNINYKKIKNIICEEKPDHIYLNSMFSLFFTIYPLLIVNQIKPDALLTVAPRGMLYGSALSKKWLKKKIYLFLSKWLYSCKKLRFHATNSDEALAIQKMFGNRQIFIANNLPAQLQYSFTTIEKKQGELKCIFIARIDPIKNLLLLIQILMLVKAEIVFTIIGPAEDIQYWNLCKNEISKLPENICVHIIGPVEQSNVPEYLKDSHLYVLLTKGENFGHTIFESLLAGRPVLISDQTPWRGLAIKKVGADISLKDPSSVSRFIEIAASWSQKEFDEWAFNSWKYAKEYLANDVNRELYLDIFR